MAEEERTDELDDEIAELEKELAALEKDEPEPEAPAEEEGSDEPEGEAAEDEASDEEEGSFRDKIPFLGGSKPEAEEPPEEEEPAEPALGRHEEEWEADEPSPDQPDLAESHEAPAEADEAPPPREAPRSAGRWERTPEGGWRRTDQETVEEPAAAERTAEEEEDAGLAGASTLLGRFRGGEEDEPAEEEPPSAAQDEEAGEGEPEEEEEDEERSKLVVAGIVLLALIVLAAIILVAIALLSEGGGDVQAALASDAVQQDGRYIAATGTAFQLDASGTTGTVDEYRWDFGDGATTSTTEPTVSHTYADRGTYTVVLTAVAGDSTSEATLEVFVAEAPDAQPRVLLGGEPVSPPGEVGNNVFVGQSVQLNGEDSTADPEQALTTFEWDTNGDGSPDATGATATTSFAEAGRWNVNLTVTDDLGNQGSAIQRIHVSDEQRFENETIGPAVGTPTTASHNVTVDVGRGGVTPIQLDIRLTYQATDPTGGLAGAEPEPDLDLNITSPGGSVFEADEDSGAGNESLSVTGADLAALGQWTVGVTHDPQEGLTGSGTDVEYSVFVEIIY